MKPAVVVAVVGLLGAAAGAGSVLLVGSAGLESSPRLAALDTELLRLGRQLEEGAARSAALAQELAALRQRVDGLAGGGSTPLALAEIDEAVERALAARQAGAAAGAGDAAALALGTSPDGAEPALTAADAFARLCDPETSNHDSEMLWQRIREAGLTDELVAMFEQLAEENPYDSDVKVALGVAYLQKIQEVGQSPLAGVLATKADKSFDAALALDDTNWDARFTKAMALSFWPPIFGKQNEAVNQFEKLIEQQRTIPGDPRRYAQTYVLLGNMYNQMGKGDKAMATWTAGLQLYPDNADLKQQIASAQ